MKAALLVALCATASALKPTTRRDVLAKVLTASTAAVPVASFARSEAEMDARSTGGSADEDMKGLLSGYKTDLTAKEKARDRVHVLFFARARRTRVAQAAAQKKLDEEKSIQEKIKLEFEKQQNAPKRPGPGTATTARPKAAPKAKYTGDGLPGS